MKQFVLTGVAGACVLMTGCAAPYEAAQNRIRPIVREATAEVREFNDLRVDTWRDLRKLETLYACSLSKGAIERADLTEEEKADLDATDCR